uniref:PsbA, PsbB, PsbC, PsbD, PsbE-FCP supercomplex, PLANT PROTEIN n=1 Tax=Inoviridae sp. ctDDr4 TaxID=2825777 RepID=A0A8S5V5Z6_9VIRU|nr:MAG TPA: PsbA, PsbB, PsbC, PsbD, PsbE-FCP supercomplex, PLANT PROTEIN [Inoviridae sp. ctDDr4]
MYLMFFVFGFLYNDLLDLVVEPTLRKWRKECEFDCSKCKGGVK